MKSGVKKGFGIGVNILIWVIIIVAAVFIFMTISSNSNSGMPTIFGRSLVSVLSGSMVGDKPDSFTENDLIIINSDMSDEEKNNLKVGQIITFKDYHFYDNVEGMEGQYEIVSHRIIDVAKSGNVVSYGTKGDHNTERDPEYKTINNIIGVYQTKLTGLGAVLKFMKSFWGFFWCLILPLTLFFIWRVIKFILVLRDLRKVTAQEKLDAAVAAALANNPQAQAGTQSHQEMPAEDDNVQINGTSVDAQDEKK